MNMRRRTFLKSSTAGAFTLANIPFCSAKGSDKIKVGLIGCGRRGTKAAANAVAAAEGVEIVALADAFGEQFQSVQERFKVRKKRCFTGLNAYRELLALDDVNYVILATPPAFRPQHFAEAISRGKHVFMEKPVAVCPAGITMVSESGKLAETKGLGVVAGTQRRHFNRYVETMKRIHAGAIGDIISAQCYWNMGGVLDSHRGIPQENIDWQLKHWYYLKWLSADHIVEQHVHNIDVINWAFNAMPESVYSLAGRQFRTGPDYGNIFDHFGTEFIYANDVLAMSMCRQIQGTSPKVEERVVGTKGASNCAGTITGENAWKYEGPQNNPYIQEHADLINSIRSGKPLNETQQVANSTLCAIAARESGYMRKQFKLSYFLAKNQLNLLPPDNMKLSDTRPIDPVPVPGEYKTPGLMI